MGGQKSKPINLTTETNQSEPNQPDRQPINSRQQAIRMNFSVFCSPLPISLSLCLSPCLSMPAYLRACASVQERNDHYGGICTPPLFRSVKILVAFLQFFFEIFFCDFFLNFFCRIPQSSFLWLWLFLRGCIF